MGVTQGTSSTALICYLHFATYTNSATVRCVGDPFGLISWKSTSNQEMVVFVFLECLMAQIENILPVKRE